MKGTSMDIRTYHNENKGGMSILCFLLTNRMV